MTKRTRLLLAGAAVVVAALVPGAAYATTIGGGRSGTHCQHPAGGTSTGASAPSSY